MCTVSVIPLGTHSSPGYRLVASRDESRARAVALPPEMHTSAGEIPALWPTDPDAGGTWVSVNAAGVALTILNVNSAEPNQAPEDVAVSRGLIIPALASVPTAADAAAYLARVDLSRFRPFRLVAVDPSGIMECHWDAESLGIFEGPLAPSCFSSHGWGDRRARHRLYLFRRWFAERPYTADEQDSFHRHRWPSRPEISVRMSREEGRTVSITSVTVAETIEMAYEPLDLTGEHVTLRLEALDDSAVGAPA